MEATTSALTHRVLVCNAGSSSLKLAHCEVSATSLVVLQAWQVEGTAGVIEESLLTTLRGIDRCSAVAHRVVHAGEITSELAALDEVMLATIAHWTPLAPLHNAMTLRLITAVAGLWPGVAQYAAFDSGLYCDLPDVASYYPLPGNLSRRWPLKRYGFHGLAHRSQWRSVRSLIDPNDAHSAVRQISIHLGSGCSLTCWNGAQVIDTSMGFTPLEGLVMATRSGSLDPGLLIHLLTNEEHTPEELADILSRKSGLAAVEGANGDMRLLLASASDAANLAVAHYCYQVRKAIGGAMAVLGGVDVISIGGGVGEHQPQIRKMILGPLRGLGIYLDELRNASASTLEPLHSEESPTQIWLAPVDETNEILQLYQQKVRE